jgi:dTMP kinase
MEANKHKGKFIVLEGLDGSGQSTQVGLLREFLIAREHKVLTTKEPTIDSEAGRKIKEALEKKIKIDPAELQKLFAQDRKEHLEKTIIPALKGGEFVVSDRYFFSTFAYGASDGLDLDWLIKINNDFLLPDMIFILKVRPEVCIKRIENRGTEKTLFEKEQKLARVWETYEILPQRFENSIIIDGEKTIEEVFENIKEIINKRIFQA